MKLMWKALYVVAGIVMLGVIAEIYSIIHFVIKY
jgi:hypothetical protein